MSQNDNPIEFITSIYKNSGGGFKIWIPKKIMSELPDDIWTISYIVIENEDNRFRQILKDHPLSKAGRNQGYIPIYCEEVVTDYKELGKVSISMRL